MIRTFSFKIRHSDKHSEWIESVLGTTRYVYNLAKQTKEDSYSAGLSLGNYDLQKQFTECKKEEGFEWLKQTPSQTSQAIIERLDKAYKSFYKGGGYPKWASKKNWKSIPFKGIRQVANNTFKLPKLGDVKVFSPRNIEGDLRTSSIVREADGYYLKIQVKIEEPEVKTKKYKDLSADRGIVNFIVTSDGEYIENPRINSKTETKLRILNRKLSRTKKDSNNRLLIINQIQRLYLKRQRQRTDFLHKLTSSIAKDYEVVYLEDLSTSKMVQDKRFSKSISDLGWYKFEELLSYKTEVRKVNAAYTSQECSKCGNISKENRKTQSLFKCTKCNFTMNADEQACLNILKRGRADLDNAKVNQ